MNPCGGASSDREPMDLGRSLDGRGRAVRFRKSVSVTAFGGAWALVFSGNPVEVRRMMSRSVLGQSVKAWWRQLSLGVLLIAVGYVALFLALVVVPAQAQRRGRRWVESQWPASDKLIQPITTAPRHCVRSILGCSVALSEAEVDSAETVMSTGSGSPRQARHFVHSLLWSIMLPP